MPRSFFLELIRHVTLTVVLKVGCSDGDQARKNDLPVSKPTVTVASHAITSSHAQEPDDAQKLALVNRLRPEVETFCGACHAKPIPDSVEQANWPREVAKGFEFYRLSARTDLHVPSVKDVTDYYAYQAPEKLTMPVCMVRNPLSVLDFRPKPVFKSSVPSVLAQPPCISHLAWIDLGGRGEKSIVYCDLGTGSIYAFDPRTLNSVPTRLGVLFQPVKFDPCDLDGDGRMDLVVADLGELAATDSDLGRVVWLKQRESSDQYEQIVLREGLGRVADVRVADFDGDGDPDILVAEFGYRVTGRILMLENVGTGEVGHPKFEMRVIDERHGSMELPLVDLNGDGHLDFVALISQEFEVVEAFINNGAGNFEVQTIWKANDPIYGSARIELADIDSDGDVDVVFANGDSFDNGSKPFHSVQWLENKGTFPFEHHHITHMPGVLAIKVADFDGDGDLDIVAGALVAERFDESLEAAGVESLILLEQISPGEFKRTAIEISAYQHGAIEVGDFDDDGQIDIAAWNFLHFQPDLSTRQDFTIWKNFGKR